MNELIILIQEHQPDIIAVQEILHKNSVIIPDQHQFHIQGYTMYTNQENWKRGVALYVQEGIPSRQYYQDQDQNGEEQVWCSIKLKNTDTLIVGSIYRSPNSTRTSTIALFDSISKIVDKNPSHLLIMGDFNLPRIDWNLVTSPNSMECLDSIFDTIITLVTGVELVSLIDNINTRFIMFF